MNPVWLNKFRDGVWTGNADRTIVVEGVSHDIDEYAKEHGIKLPESKKQPKKKKQVNSYADMEQQDSGRDTTVDGTGSSQSTE